MSDKPDGKKEASRVLGIKQPLERPKQIYRQGVHHTPFGTETRLEPTPEGRKYLSALEREKAEHERDKAKLSQVPRAPGAAKEQTRIFKRTDRTMYNRGKDKDKDIER